MVDRGIAGNAIAAPNAMTHYGTPSPIAQGRFAD
jgi:hypothetical protein